MQDWSHIQPGRIQTLSSEQEIVLKQVWAHFLIYFGYEINFPINELVYPECFVTSLSVQEGGFKGNEGNGLARTSTRGSLNSNLSRKTNGTTSSKKRGFFGKKKTETQEAAPADLKRMQQIQQQSSLEKYHKVTEDDISDQNRNLFIHYYRRGAEYEDDYDSDLENSDDEADNLSLETFVTASTSITDPGIAVEPTPMKSNGTRNGSSNARSRHHHGSHKNHGKPNPSVSPVMSKYDPIEVHTALFRATRLDLFDNFVLRFVRARKLKLEPALNMMFKSLDWRYNDMPCDDYIFEADGLSFVNGINKGFIKNLTTSKSYIRGVDKKQHPIFFFKARLHYSSDSPIEETQRFAVFTIESCRLFLREVSSGVDQCSILFDLTGFTLKNNDYSAIKFLAEVFEAHYPECLGYIFIHNAPWIFSTIWNIIKNWLDPVVASKIHFTKNLQELNQFVEIKHIPDYIGGEDTYAGEYIEPTQKHVNPPKAKDKHYYRLKREREALMLRMMETSRRWVESVNPEVSSQYLQDKIDLDIELARNYIASDPYVRAPGLYDRNGALTLDI